jgi:hypothetical protein
VPDAGVAFVAKAGAANTEARPVAEFVTDATGKYTVRLPPGEWCLVPASRPAKPPTGAPIGGDLAAVAYVVGPGTVTAPFRG